MKQILYVALALTMISQASCKEEAPKLELKFRVVDDTGQPVEEATVRMSGNVGVEPGAGGDFGKDAKDVDEKKTNEQGEAPLSIRFYNYFGGYVTKKGYYKTAISKPEVKKEGNKWIPTESVCKVVLRAKKNPIPLYVNELNAVLPQENKEFGYDLLKRDWVAPSGQGEVADVLISMSGFYKRNEQKKLSYDSKVKIKFLNQGDGFVVVDDFKENSRLKMPYEAPLGGYKNLIVWRKMKDYDGNHQSENLSSPGRCYFVRIRTKMNESGEIVSAIYGKIHNDIQFGAPHPAKPYVKFSALYFNPTPNDRNLEFDPSKNLFKGVDRIFAP